MKRFVSVWLPLWSIERLRHHSGRAGSSAAVPDEVPLALVEGGQHGIRIAAVNRAAAREGVRIGTSLADARAALPTLLSRPAEPGRDKSALLKLARWAGRYGPARNRDGEDGIWIDITGAAHLLGGEAALLADLSTRLAGFHLTHRLGLADTPGAAHALARFAPMASRPWVLAPAGETRAALAGLPVEALRITPEATLLLRRLGLRRIGQLYDLPRPAIERRFRSGAASRSEAGRSVSLAGALLARLDLALGTAADPRRPLDEPPVLTVRRAWAEPLISAEALENETGALAAELAAALAAAGLGARRIRLTLYRADGTIAEVAAGLSRASRAPDHLMRLLKERLAAVDAGFGIDVAALDALAVERLDAVEIALAEGAGQNAEAEIAALVDRIASRLGAARITCLASHASHVPERAERRIAFAPRLEPLPVRVVDPTGRRKGRRPPFLLASPEPITVMAEVPEGPPRHFTWRRVRHSVVRAEGPERIAPEWWRTLGAEAPKHRTRDYYRIEDDAGAGYWVFREGLYQQASEDGAPRWFLHGLFG